MSSVEPHIYVVAEVGGTGPVKLGVATRHCSTGRPGLNSGNFRELEVLHRHSVPLAGLRWSEWLIHRRLRSHHVRGEWFDVRHLVDNSRSEPAAEAWRRFVGGVLAGSAAGIETWELRGSNGHQLARMERLSPHGGRRHFRAMCSCGAALDGELREAMPTVQVRFAVKHLELDPSSPAVKDLARQIHQRKRDES